MCPGIGIGCLTFPGHQLNPRPREGAQSDLRARPLRGRWRSSCRPEERRLTQASRPSPLRTGYAPPPRAMRLTTTTVGTTDFALRRCSANNLHSRPAR